VNEYYIAIVGIDGSGKSTQAKLLTEALECAFPDRLIFATREPGNSSRGVDLRAIAIDHSRYAPTTRALAIALDRALNIEENISPALNGGAIVVSDRCFVCSLVYQGHGEGIPHHVMSSVCELAICDVVPDLILWIDTPPQVAIDRLRLSGKPADYFESKGVDFLEKLRNGYLGFELGTGMLTRVEDVGTATEMTQKLLAIATAAIGENAVEFLPKS
jgi:dTMP kinase